MLAVHLPAAYSDQGNLEKKSFLVHCSFKRESKTIMAETMAAGRGHGTGTAVKSLYLDLKEREREREREKDRESYL